MIHSSFVAEAGRFLVVANITKLVYPVAINQDCHTSSQVSIMHTATASMAQVPCRKQRHRVSFGTVQVRQYNMILGDHPAVSYGPAVTLDWWHDSITTGVHQNVWTWDVLEWEKCRQRSRKSSRRHHLVLNYYQRLEILQRAGYTWHQITQASQATIKAQRQRRATRVLTPFHRVLEAGLDRSKAFIVGKRSTSVSSCKNVHALAA